MARRPLVEVLRQQRPELEAPEAAIAAGWVQVEGAIVTNPKSQVLSGARIVVREEKGLKGEAKLAAGIDALGGFDATGLTALDLGASTGGFTTELLNRGAAKVYAVDVGHGQLMGALRQDPRVVNLEQTNATDLTRELVPDQLQVVTIDVSYSPLRAILPPVTETLLFATGAVLFALIKPMFELQAAELPTSTTDLAEAVMVAEQAIRAAGWAIDATVESPLRGNGGAVEYFARARLLELPQNG
ncbi:MAG: SAM-dependent methyltransferase [Acidimicrobiales bacterium]|nr:SAM-dependent methyltransferase [Acidimicrobiales bacterium]